MDLRFSDEDEAFRAEVRGWLDANLTGEFEKLRGRGGPGDEHEFVEERIAWERHLGAAGWCCIGFPEADGGRGATLHQQVIFYEEYARAGAPGRVGIVNEGLIGPTLVAFGTPEQKKRFLPGITGGTEIWCQGYSEPDAGSDLANVQTRAALDGDQWVISGQKVWTSLAHFADWCFVLCRTDTQAPKHRGISYLLVPMAQDGVSIQPIRQITGTSEFNEVFFDDARTDADNVVGEINGGWKVAMGTLAFERGASTLGQQLAFENELNAITNAARHNGRLDDPIFRQRITDAWIGLRIMRVNALRTLSGMEGDELTREGMITKLYWASWHRRLGELAVDILGPEGLVADGAPYDLSAAQRLFLFTRSDTIYGGSNQIQRTIIGERALGLPAEPKVAS
ncbi:MAG: acyl-CoA dehydrogenase family protein [Acidimicrobiia bacterium]